MLAEYYHSIYIIIVTLLTILAYNGYRSKSPLVKEGFPSLLLMLFFVFFIGFRPVSAAAFVDMAAYADTYTYYYGENFFFNVNTDNVIFDHLLLFWASREWSLELYFSLIAFIYFGGIYLASRKMFPNAVLLAFVVYLAGFSTFSYATNGIKAGCAASVFLVAVAYRKEYYISVPLAILSYGFHHSMVLPIVAFVAVYFVKNPKYYFWLWCICLLLAAMKVTFFQTYLAGFTDEHGAEYLLSKRNSGFRLDFILYSSAPLLMGYYTFFVKNVKSNYYSFILRLYIFINSVWMLCMYANFNNRIAYLSWFLYPFVLIYPLINTTLMSKKEKLLPYTVFGHLAFTLFMMFVYY